MFSEMFASSVLLVGYISVYHIKNEFFLNRKLKSSALKPPVATNSKFELLMKLIHKTNHVQNNYKHIYV